MGKTSSIAPSITNTDTDVILCLIKSSEVMLPISGNYALARLDPRFLSKWNSVPHVHLLAIAYHVRFSDQSDMVWRLLL